MRFRLLVTGLFLVSIIVSAQLQSHAQTQPAGQVSHRRAVQATDTGVAARTVYDIKRAQVAQPAGFFNQILNEAAIATASSDEQALKTASGAARQAAWRAVVALDYKPNVPPGALQAARSIALVITDDLSLSEARKVADAAKSAADAKYGSKNGDVTSATSEVLAAIQKVRCSYSTTSSATSGGAGNGGSGGSGKPRYQFQYPTFFPLIGPGCTNEAITNFFGVFQVAEMANSVKYLYNAQQSASQINSDLLTATFVPGFQAVLAGTATSGSGQTSTTSSPTMARAPRPNATSPANGNATSNDSVSTAVSKMEAGGDFNVRFPLPVVYHYSPSYSLAATLLPNLGFNLSKFGSQSTITGTDEYSVNVPLEFYAQTKSLNTDSGGNASATMFLDVRPAAELISSALATKIGLTSGRGFFLGQAAAGIEFSNNLRISFQYVYGPEQIYQMTSSSGSSSTTKTRIGGFHLAVSFSPQKSKQ